MRGHRGGCVGRWILLGGILGGCSTFPLPAEEHEVLNYAFSSQLGSGIYQVSGRTVQIYRIPLYLRVPGQAEDPGVRVTFPICIGFFDLKPGDVDTTVRSDDVATASLVPGIAVQFPVRRNWWLEPYVEFGHAQDFDGRGSAYVYALGLRSTVVLERRGYDLRLGQRLVYAGAHTSGSEIDADFAMLETGLEVRRPITLAVRGHALDGGLFVMNYLYLEPTRVILKETPLDVGVQYEVGLTGGTQVPVPLWRFTFPRVGLGYRFGDGVSAIRLVLGAAF